MELPANFADIISLRIKLLLKNAQKVLMGCLNRANDEEEIL